MAEVYKHGKVTWMGDLLTGAKGTKWISFGLSHTPYTPKGEPKAETKFYEVKCFRELAVNVFEEVAQGDYIVVIGDGQVQEYTSKAGEEKSKSVILANHLGVDLSRAAAKPDQGQFADVSEEAF